MSVLRGDTFLRHRHKHGAKTDAAVVQGRKLHQDVEGGTVAGEAIVRP